MSDLRYLGDRPHVFALRALSTSTGGALSGDLAIEAGQITRGRALIEGRGGIEAVTVDSGTLAVRSWSLSAGAWSVQVACDADGAEILRSLERGSSLGLFVRFLDTPTSSTELMIAAGRLDRVSGMVPSMTLRVNDMAASLRHPRWDGTLFLGAKKGVLFGSLTTDELASSYTSGDATVTVVDGSGFEVVDSDTGHGADLLGIVDNSGNTFYLLWTSESLNVITLDSSVTSAGDDENAYDTDRAGASSTNVVYEYHVLWGKPWDIARKVITSTSGGTNGAYDTLIDDAGMAVPSALVASGGGVVGWNECEDNIAISLGGYDIDILVTDAVDNPLSWLQGYLEPLGLVIVDSYGQVDMRAIWDPEKAPADLVRAHITDAEVVRIQTWEAYDSATDVHYYNFDVINGTDEVGAANYGTLNPDTSRFPLRRSKKLECPALWHKRADGYHYEGDAGNVDDYSTYISDEVVERIGRFYWDTPERIVLEALNGGNKRLAALVPGDIVELTTARTGGRPSASVGQTYSQRRALVLRRQTNWPPSGAPTVTLTLSILPVDYQEPDTL